MYHQPGGECPPTDKTNNNMALVTVERVQRRKVMSDPKSPIIHYLKQKSGDSKVYDLKRLSEEIETVGSLSIEDVQHVLRSFVRSMKIVLRDGNRVKIDGLGTFYITLCCPGVPTKDECTVRNIKRVNIRFKVDNVMRLVNDSIATTRAGANNVEFTLYTPKEEKDGKEPTPPTPPVPPVPPGDDEEDPIVDPTA